VDRFLDTPVKCYSSGMYVRLAFAVAAHLDPEILIVGGGIPPFVMYAFAIRTIRRHRIMYLVSLCGWM
jgi:ABC-type polysaccharide/polyol phosphate transport system ATPase subunit